MIILFGMEGRDWFFFFSFFLFVIKRKLVFRQITRNMRKKIKLNLYLKCTLGWQKRLGCLYSVTSCNIIKSEIYYSLFSFSMLQNIWQPTALFLAGCIRLKSIFPRSQTMESKYIMWYCLICSNKVLSLSLLSLILHSVLADFLHLPKLCTEVL